MENDGLTLLYCVNDIRYIYMYRLENCVVSAFAAGWLAHCCYTVAPTPVPL